MNNEDVLRSVTMGRINSFISETDLCDLNLYVDRFKEHVLKKESFVEKTLLDILDGIGINEVNLHKEVYDNNHLEYYFLDNKMILSVEFDEDSLNYIIRRFV